MKFFCHLDRLLFPVISTERKRPLFVISTERSEWRDLINAPFGASGKPQRYLDYARYDRGGYARHDKGRRCLGQAKRQSRALDYARHDKGVGYARYDRGKGCKINRVGRKLLRFPPTRLVSSFRIVTFDISLD